MSSEGLVPGAAGEALERTLATGRIASSYLFEGDDPDDVAAGARAFAARLLARGAEGEAADRIARRVAEETHPDLHVLRKDKPTVISVAALEPVLEQAHQTPLEGEHQVFLVDPADAMEPEGVARYLKTLEEPPPGTVFVLVTTHADRLPTTVLSRCRRVRIPGASTEQIAEVLQQDGIDSERARTLASWATGSLARARRIADHRLDEVAGAMWEAARDRTPRLGRTAEEAVSHLEREAGAWSERTSGGGELKRQGVRRLLGDTLHVLAVEARQRAAGREAELLGEDVDAETAMALLAGVGELAASVAANVTPAVIVLETLRLLRQEAFA